MRNGALLLLSASLLCNCARGHPVADTPAHDAPAAATGPDTTPARREPGALRTVAADTVHDRTGPDGRPFEIALRTADGRNGHARRYGQRTLPIQLRTRAPDLTQYPCTSCHMHRAIVLANERRADAHTALRTVHPAETGATCATCHAPDDVELLALKNGERVTLDHVYRLCAQCHFEQVEAWSKGGHGKRLDGWQGRRVVMSCADCHDPHAPALDARMPFRPPRLHRPGSPKHD